jgi:hypothetical protein
MFEDTELRPGSATLCGDIISSSNCVTLDDMMTVEQWLGKEWSRPNLRYYPRICVQTVRKSTKRSLKIGRVSGKIKKRVSQI